MSDRTPYPELKGDFLEAVRVVLDEEKIIKENKYNLEKIKARIRLIYNRRNCEILDSDNLIFISGDNSSLKKAMGNFNSTNLYLANCKWFIYNVKEWDTFFNTEVDGLCGWDDIYRAFKNGVYLKNIEEQNDWEEE